MCLLLTLKTTFFKVSVVDFEQINVSWPSSIFVSVFSVEHVILNQLIAYKDSQYITKFSIYALSIRTVYSVKNKALDYNLSWYLLHH